MAAPSEAQANGSSRTMRVAIEGCGHGTLDAIYASIHKACEVKGWDGVDLVIICGDFQAVRDRRDLNVTAMPAKYRQMADFHQYYWGTKTAPFLTIFIGGNHEASNHLFELYYGGWAAPNIYYLGAANVIQVGSVKVAAMSGIWKGYDYRKPHYERLPYSQNDIYSIFHVRELDVRKLLSFRSQVDIGLSHDWPKGIEWLGNHRQLFKYKAFLREDAESGKLGNDAAAQVMDRLRPPFWFSAHLHARYPAIKTYDGKDGKHGKDQSKRQASAGEPEARQLSKFPQQDAVSAWKNFSDEVEEHEARQMAEILQEGRARREEAERVGTAMTANYAIRETFKKIKLGDGLDRTVASVSRVEATDDGLDAYRPLPQLDGGCASLPLKRRRDVESSPAGHDPTSTKYTAVSSAPIDGLATSFVPTAATLNPDAIDIDMSDDDDEMELLTSNLVAQGRKTTSLDIGTGEENFTEEDGLLASAAKVNSPGRVSRDDLVPLISDHKPTHSGTSPRMISNSPYQYGPTRDRAESSPAGGKTQAEDRAQIETDDTREILAHESELGTFAVNNISEDTLNELRARSNIFEPSVPVSAPLPHPEGIKNDTTRFLALSKCEDKQSFLQLLEIRPHDSVGEIVERPVKLRYVPEWLAILRVFASELTLGGGSDTKISTHRGDTHYRGRILEEEKWVEDNVTRPGRLQVPENFVKSISEDTIHMPIDARDMPREVSNPQTSTFCNLIGIDNPFDITEEERDARMAAGPAESDGSSRRIRGQRGGKPRARDHRGGRGRGNRGRGGHGRGRGW